ncbi:MAG: hypothetical protein M1824_005933 [Vezdaea acicularis]|nr:MAG: hypothetical protein M1824_005933 [Vezdaea acicularis]
MALPPEKILIKRKRTDEPVGALYLEQHNTKKRRDLAYKLLPDPDIKPINPISSPTSICTRSLVPPTSPNKFLPKATRVERRYHLATKRKRQSGDIATFVERTRLLKKPRSLLSLQKSDTDAPKTNNDTQKQQTEPGSARKRPQATAAELAFRKTTWQTRPRQQEEIASRDGIAPAENIVNDPQPDTSGTGAAPSTAALAADPQAPDQQKLAEELTIFAQRTVSGLKVKPKPPARRYHERHPSASPPRVVAEGIDQDMDMGGGDAADADADGMEYVYDTYIRHQVDATADQIESVGVLVIPEEDEEGWNEFGSRSESDSEGGGSDDADSNAEDFYANDYPDEEVRSDDEYGRGAYRYRKNASDDEDWAEDVGSDDDERSRYPWKGNAWGV